MSKEVYIIGAGGHSRSVISLLQDQGFKVLGIFDDSYTESRKEVINSVQLLGKIEDYKSKNELILAIGDNFTRMDFFRKFSDQIYSANIFHSRSFVETSASLGSYNLIFGNSFINSNVIIGNNNIINTGSILEHEVILGSHNHISVGAIICGRVNIGDNCFLGAGSVLNPCVSICSNVIVGSNSTVINSITEPGTYVGQPAVKVNKK